MVLNGADDDVRLTRRCSFRAGAGNQPRSRWIVCVDVNNGKVVAACNTLSNGFKFTNFFTLIQQHS